MTVREREHDGGFTLIEVVVALAVMSLVMALATGGFIQLYSTFRSTSAVGDAQAQVGHAFQRLDNELRYAADMRTSALSPGDADDSSLVYLSTAAGVRCHALTLADGQLQRRHWTIGGHPGQADVLAAGVTRISGVAPFAVSGGGSTGDAGTPMPVTPKEAVITLAVTAGGVAEPGRRELKQAFLAPNTIRGPQGGSLDDCLA